MPKNVTGVLPENWEETAYGLFEQGASALEVFTEFGFTAGQHAALRKNNTDYDVCFDTGKYISQAWWERQGRMNVNNKQFNATVWYMNMKNKFGWRDTPLDPTKKNSSVLTDRLAEAENIEKYSNDVAH